MLQTGMQLNIESLENQINRSSNQINIENGIRLASSKLHHCARRTIARIQFYVSIQKIYQFQLKWTCASIVMCDKPPDGNIFHMFDTIQINWTANPVAIIKEQSNTLTKSLFLKLYFFSFACETYARTFHSVDEQDKIGNKRGQFELIAFDMHVLCIDHWWC